MFITIFHKFGLTGSSLVFTSQSCLIYRPKGSRCFPQQETLPLLRSTGWFQEWFRAWFHNWTRI